MYAADVTPGDTVCVVGVGGIGANAIQGAKLAGAKRIIAIDPVEFKREKAMEFGATHTASSMAEAFGLVQDITWGTMANKVIMTMGVGDGGVMGEAVIATEFVAYVDLAGMVKSSEISTRALIRPPETSGQRSSGCLRPPSPWWLSPFVLVTAHNHSYVKLR